MKGLEFIFLGVGSVLGAYLRYKITESPLLFNTLPINVLIVNVLGAFVLGAFVILSQHWHLDGRYSLFAAVGFCGSLTTMSALALDSTNLLENNQYVTFNQYFCKCWTIHFSINWRKILNECNYQ